MANAAARAAVVQMSEGLRLNLRPMGIEQFAILMTETVGEQVAAAIVNDTFMLYAHPQVRIILVARASDWNSLIDRQSDQVAGLA